MAHLRTTLLAIASIFVIILLLSSPHEACRLLDGDESLAKNGKIIFNNLHLQVLQMGSVSPPGPNGCSYVGSRNPCKSD